MENQSLPKLLINSNDFNVEEYLNNFKTIQDISLEITRLQKKHNYISSLAYQLNPVELVLVDDYEPLKNIMKKLFALMEKNINLIENINK